MKRAPWMIWGLLALLVQGPGRVGEATNGITPFAEQMRTRLEAAGAGLAMGGDRIHTAKTLIRFYSQRRFQPAWTEDGTLRGSVDDLVEALEGAFREGLNPDDYHLPAIRRLVGMAREDAGVRKTIDVGVRIDLELLLTDAFLLYGSHCLSGRLDPVSIDPEWVAAPRSRDMALHLEEALSGSRVPDALRHLLPPQPGYARLRNALERYRALEEGAPWPAVPGPKLERGLADDRVRKLTERLAREGILSDEAVSEIFDDTVHEAVIRFQGRYGLEEDGVVGPATLRELNVPVSQRVSQIRVNLERWRWLPQDLGEAYIGVNIADFGLEVVNAGSVALEMAVVVGREYRRTPVFSARMTYVVFNPWWEVPRKIAAKDILPEIRKDPEYASRLGFQLLEGWGTGAAAIDPHRLAGGQAPGTIRVRQRPGPQNALGAVKFMFPNRFDVYLHDTPKRELFSQRRRAFSSGCIRVSKPLELAEFVLAGGDWNKSRINDAVRAGKERTVHLSRPVPVHILYWTAWADESGTVHFREDLYGRDQRVGQSLLQAPPVPG